MTEKLPLIRSVVLPFIVAVIAALVLGACSGDTFDVSVGQESSRTADTSAATETSSESVDTAAPLPTPELTDEQLAMVDPTGLIAEVITDLGADPSNAPAAALDLQTADFCGFDVVDDASDGSREDPAARACFISGVANNVETVLVQSRPDAGTQVVHVFRVDPARGAVTDYSDRDGWSGQVCSDVVAEPAEGPNQFTLAECAAL